MAIRKPWDKEKPQLSKSERNQAREDGTERLEREVKLKKTTWSTSQAVRELGGTGKDATRKAALAMLAERGITAPGAGASKEDSKKYKTQLTNEQRNLQRYLKFEETNKKGPNSFEPAPAKSAMLKELATRKATAKGVHVQISGETAVNGYQRYRSISIHLTGDQAADFMDDPNFAVLAENYGKQGVGELLFFSGIIDIKFGD